MAHPIQRAAVLGAGVMGATIAGHLAGAGIEVELMDIVPRDASSQSRSKLALDGKKALLKTGGVYCKSAADLITCGNFEDHLDRLAAVDWVIEAVVENLEIKRSLYGRIAPHLAPHAIVSSNTSGMSIAAMADCLPAALRGNFLGVHFFNPPRYMKLVELIPTPQTDPAVTAAMSDCISRRLGKGVIVAKDTPNFIANRIGVFASVNTMQLGEKHGLNFTELDYYTGAFIGRSPSATFRTTDLVGLDTTVLVAGSVQRSVPDGEKSAFALPAYITEMTERGLLGNKSGSGFFQRVRTPVKEVRMWSPQAGEYVSYTMELPQWAAALPKRSAPAQAIEAARKSETPSGDFVWEAVRDTLLYAAERVGEITDDFRKIDLALQWGYNWEMGPFALWDSMGAEETAARFTADGKTVPAWVADHLAANGGRFYTDTPFAGLLPAAVTVDGPGQRVVRQAETVSLLDIGDGVALLALHAKGNTLDAATAAAIREMLQTVKTEFAALVIGNDGKNFSTGANLAEIAALAQAGKTAELDRKIKNFQDMMLDIKYLGRPVVAAPFGQTLGGGCEMCLHATATVANAETYMGLVEIGVGLVPGGGGTKEMAIRAAQWGEKAAGGDFLEALKAYCENITMAKVTKSAMEGLALGLLRPADRINMDKLTLLREAKETALGLLPCYRPAVHSRYKVLGNTGYGALKAQADFMLEGGWISEYDAFLALQVARILCGGDVPMGTLVTEQELLDLERATFLMLAAQEKTLARIDHMLQTGKPLRN